MNVLDVTWPPWGCGDGQLTCMLILCGLFLYEFLGEPGGDFGGSWEVALWQCCILFSVDLFSRAVRSFFTWSLGTWLLDRLQKDFVIGDTPGRLKPRRVFPLNLGGSIWVLVVYCGCLERVGGNCTSAAAYEPEGLWTIGAWARWLIPTGRPLSPDTPSKVG